MAIKAGDVITIGNTILIDRLQSGGPSLSIPQEQVYELGNYFSVATVRDIADLTFTNESWDVAPEFEAMLVGGNFATDIAGTEYQLANSRPIDIANEFKRGKLDPSLYDTAGSAVIPYLTLESMSYRFGLRDNAAKTATLRGDSIFYSNASAYIQETTGTNTASQVINFAHAPITYLGDVVAGTRYALSVTNTVTGKRLLLGTDYTETSTAVTVLVAVPITQKVRIAYQSAVVANYPQVSHAVDSATRPSAIKGKYLDVRVGGNTSGDRWQSVQAATAEYRVTIDKDEEFGNPNVVASDYDVPQVSGTVDVKARDVAELIVRLRQTAGAVASGQSIGPYTAAPVPLYILMKSPVDGTTISTLYVPDARFTLPGFNVQVQQKVTISLPWTSDLGKLSVFKGDVP